MKFGSLLLIIVGVGLMLVALSPALQADTLDMGGCAGKSYPCVSTTVYGTVHWTGRQEVTTIVINVPLPGGEGMGYSNSLYTDSNGQYYISSIPSWDEIAGTWHNYEGSVDVFIGGSRVATQDYWRLIAGGVTTYSDNHASGDSYRLDFTVDTPGDPGESSPEFTEHYSTSTTNIVTGGQGQPMWGVFFIGLALILIGVWMSKGG